MVDLLPCPFCGAPAEMDTQRGYRNISTGKLENSCAIYCTECSADMSICYRDVSDWAVDDAVAHLTEAWNRRTEPIIAPAECGCDDPNCGYSHTPLTLRQAYENALSRLREAEANVSRPAL